MSLSFAFALLLFSSNGVLSQNYGDLRLLQGDRIDPSFTAGRLEIYINSTWGTICADNFDMDEANVACRQLGYQGAISTETSFHTPYGRGRGGPIWLDEVGCEDESIMHILSCANVGIGEHDCDHFSDVAVECMDQPRVTDPQSVAVRLTGGEFASEGRVEIHCNGQWGAACNQVQFDEREARVVCRQLGYTEASGISFVRSVPVESLQLPVWPGQLDCPANATDSIASCAECGSETSSEIIMDCSTVTVRCAHTIPYGSIRLVQGTEAVPDASAGRLEIFRNGVWGTVCSSTFDSIAANISCKELGFLRTLGFENSTAAGFGEGSGPVHLTRFQCTRDQVLNECSEITSSEECTHEQDVAIACTNDPIPPPPTTTGPTEAEEPKISRTTFIGIMVGCSLLLILCCICCAVCSIHFYLVPYDTKKERHTLYFIEREGSVAGSVMEAETNLDQKLAELDGDPFEDMDDKGKFVPRSRPNRYVSLDTNQPDVPGAASVPGPQLSSSVPQPTAHGAVSRQPSESPTSLRRVSVHSLHLSTTGSPQISHPSPLSKHRCAPSKGSVSSQHSCSNESFTFPTPPHSRGGSLTSAVPIGIPIPPPLKHQMEKDKKSEQEQRPLHNLRNASHMSGSDPTLALASQRGMRGPERGSAAPQGEEPPLATTAHAASTSQLQSQQVTTPTKSIIKSSPSLKKKETTKPHQSMPLLDCDGPADNTSLGCHQTEPNGVTETQTHHVSFLLD